MPRHRRAQEVALNEAKNSWQSFNSKASSKSKSGYKRGKAKQSIFATPDTLDGKVGVVGSGAVPTKALIRV
jgi:survival-of-motor-neuron-related-splicing factor 30